VITRAQHRHDDRDDRDGHGLVLARELGPGPGMAHGDAWGGRSLGAVPIRWGAAEAAAMGWARFPSLASCT